MKQLAWAVGFVIAAMPARADAECGIPRWVGIADGGTLPVQGSVYVHHEAMRWDELSEQTAKPVFRWVGAASTLSIEKVSAVVVRVDYDAPHAFGAELLADENDDWYTPNVTFDRAWTAPSHAPRVVQYWHDISSWTCSATDSVNIQLDQPVAAVRARWTFEGKTQEWIEVPRSTESTKSVIEIGKFNCGSTTVDPKELAAGGHLELIAIRADRSEVTIAGLPDVLSTKEMPSDEHDRTMHLASMLPAVAAPAVVTPEATEPPGIGVGVLVLGLFALGGLLAFRGLPPTT
jgi:hypothetical protein